MKVWIDATPGGSKLGLRTLRIQNRVEGPGFTATLSARLRRLDVPAEAGAVEVDEALPAEGGVVLEAHAGRAHARRQVPRVLRLRAPQSQRVRGLLASRPLGL